jgi:hypothetical protein
MENTNNNHGLLNTSDLQSFIGIIQSLSIKAAESNNEILALIQKIDSKNVVK